MRYTAELSNTKLEIRHNTALTPVKRPVLIVKTISRTIIVSVSLKPVRLWCSK